MIDICVWRVYTYFVQNHSTNAFLSVMFFERELSRLRRHKNCFIYRNVTFSTIPRSVYFEKYCKSQISCNFSPCCCIRVFFLAVSLYILLQQRRHFWRFCYKTLICILTLWTNLHYDIFKQHIDIIIINEWKWSPWQ